MGAPRAADDEADRVYEQPRQQSEHPIRKVCRGSSLRDTDVQDEQGQGHGKHGVTQTAEAGHLDDRLGPRQFLGIISYDSLECVAAVQSAGAME
jgi:hypothetical protein